MVGKVNIEPIANLQSCFGEKFAVPRQPGLCPSAWGKLVFEPGFRKADFLRGIDGFSHLWLVFGFHLTNDEGWSPTVRPPRLGGNERVGVFASRSTYRPNGLGLSLVKLDKVHLDTPDGPILELSGVDLVDGTPIYDIKPYLPYAEALGDAHAGYAPAEPDRLEVTGIGKLAFMGKRDQCIVVEALSLDPRPPAGRDEPGRVFGALLCGYNVRFQVEGRVCKIKEVEEPKLED